MTLPQKRSRPCTGAFATVSVSTTDEPATSTGTPSAASTTRSSALTRLCGMTDGEKASV
ncbi:MAG: hypothetical protein IPG17_28425 [Sandaracinaceae bacterium]|nr:hypothetical protein [Sandaracinaceae bacterium]